MVKSHIRYVMCLNLCSICLSSKHSQPSPSWTRFISWVINMFPYTYQDLDFLFVFQVFLFSLCRDRHWHSFTFQFVQELWYKKNNQNRCSRIFDFRTKVCRELNSLLTTILVFNLLLRDSCLCFLFLVGLACMDTKNVHPYCKFMYEFTPMIGAKWKLATDVTLIKNDSYLRFVKFVSKFKNWFY